MALTVDFDGTSLPAGWTFNSPLAGGSLVVANGHATITAAASSGPHDSITASSATHNLIRLIHALDTTGDLDIAIRVDLDVSDRKGVAVNMVMTDGAGGFARFALNRPNTTSEFPTWFIATRLTAGGTNHLNANVNLAPSKIESGTAAWMRMTYTKASNTFNFRYSTSGATGSWVSMGSFVRAFTPNALHIGLTRVTPTTTAGTAAIGRCVDLGAAGTDEARHPVTTTYDATVVGQALGSAALPAGFSYVTNAGDTASWTGTAHRLDSNVANVGGYTWLRYTTASPLTDWELFLDLRANSFDGDSFSTLGGFDDTVTWPGDQYVPGPGDGLEVGQTARRPIRVDDMSDSDTGSSPGSTGLDETPYCWRDDLTGVNLGTATPRRLWRIRHEGTRIRYREWAFGAAEPTTWALWDGEDVIGAGPRNVWTYALSHNNPVGGMTGTTQVDVLEMTVSSLAVHVDPPAPTPGHSGGGRPLAYARWRRSPRRGR